MICQIEKIRTYKKQLPLPGGAKRCRLCDVEFLPTIGQGRDYICKKCKKEKDRVRHAAKKSKCNARPIEKSLAEYLYLMSSVNSAGSMSCWNWARSINANGYGVAVVLGKREYAHRLSYRVFKGSIAPGMTVDHLCMNTKCVNPDHLEMVTNAENVKRRMALIIDFSNFSKSRIGKRKTLCKNGHELANENVVMIFNKRRGYSVRRCKQCHQESSKRRSIKYRAKKRQDMLKN